MGRKVIKLEPTRALIIEPLINPYGKFVDIREFYKPPGNPASEWLPTRKGIDIPIDGISPQKVMNALTWAIDNFKGERKDLRDDPRYQKSDEAEEPEKPTRRSSTKK